MSEKHETKTKFSYRFFFEFWKQFKSKTKATIFGSKDPLNEKT